MCMLADAIHTVLVAHMVCVIRRTCEIESLEKYDFSSRKPTAIIILIQRCAETLKEEEHMRKYDNRRQLAYGRKGLVHF